MPLKNYIRDIQGFPKEGILFKDITPLLIDPKARNKCLEILVSTLNDKNINDAIGGGTTKRFANWLGQIGR